MIKHLIITDQMSMSMAKDAMICTLFTMILHPIARFVS